MNTAKFKTSLDEILQSPKTYSNLSVARLIEKVIQRNEGKLASNGAISVTTGKYTGRSPKDKYIVNEPSISKKIAWGEVNKPIASDVFENLYTKMVDHIKDKNELFLFNGFAGADKNHQLSIQIINEFAWQNLFVHQLFIRPTKDELKNFKPGFTVLCVPSFKADPVIDGTNSEAFIIVSYEQKIVLIGGTEYAGEMKKSIFSILNTILPENDVLPMHCSANTDDTGNVALFFGLSGTGKTTLSADPNRKLIGDDEHGWSDNTVFNFEGGCYAKTTDLTREKEPQIFDAITFGSVLENVVLDEETNEPNYFDSSLTENTRAAYPIEAMKNIVIPSVGGTPSAIIFLTADATGVLPPISKLSKEQAMYHFLSGYTSKLAGTERGITSPQATFSTCFGSPFLPLSPSVYAEMLGEKIEKHNVVVFLVNTGWTGGEYGVGKRMNLQYTRKMVAAAVNGELTNTKTIIEPIFGLAIPKEIDGIPSDILVPEKTWSNIDEYTKAAKNLAAKFKENIINFPDLTEETIKKGGPLV